MTSTPAGTQPSTDPTPTETTLVPPALSHPQPSSNPPPASAPAVLAALGSAKRKRRSSAEIAADKELKEIWRIARERAKEEKEKAKKAKELDKAVKLQRAKEKEGKKVSRFVWSEGATADLLELISMLKNEHNVALEASPGFILWSKYSKDNTDRRSTYKTLKDLTFETLERCNKALLNAYRSVRDSCAATGGEGFHAQLDKFHITEQTYNRVGKMHDTNDTLNVVGGANPTDLSDNEAGAPVSPGSRAGDNDDDEVEGDESFIPLSPPLDSTGLPIQDDGVAPGPAQQLSASVAAAARLTSTQASHLPASRGRVTSERVSSTAATPHRPPTSGAALGRSARSDRYRTNRQAVDAAGNTEEAMDSGIGLMMLFQKEAAERAEREGEREAKREEREARMEQHCMEREEQREREYEQRRREEMRDREERRQLEITRYEREEERQAQERAQDRQQSQFMQMMGQVFPTGPGQQQDGSGGNN